MSEQTYLLSFEGVSEAEANQYAEELREVLLGVTIVFGAKQTLRDRAACKGGSAEWPRR